MKHVEIQKMYWTMLILLCIMFALVAFVLIQGEGIPEDSVGIFSFVILTCVLVAMFFYQLKTEVTEKAINLSFGIGLIKKTIDLGTVTSVTVVRNKWYYGWGIRLIQNGWMWNIKGMDAVELTFKDKSRVFRIGSQEAPRLQSKIESQLNK